MQVCDQTINVVSALDFDHHGLGLKDQPNVRRDTKPDNADVDVKCPSRRRRCQKPLNAMHRTNTPRSGGTDWWNVSPLGICTTSVDT